MTKATRRPKTQELCSAVVSVILLVSLVGTACSTSTTGSKQTQATTTHVFSAPIIPQSPTPNFKIVGKRYVRKDNAPGYYVVIDPVDLSNDSFKQNVKLVLQALAKTNGGPNFTAWVLDDEAVANTKYSYDTNPGADTVDKMKAQQAAEEQHLIAGYTGGWDTTYAHSSTADDAYTISWFPAAIIDSPNVGQYVKFGEQFKP